MALLKLIQNAFTGATSRIFGQGFSNRLFGSRTLVASNNSIQPVIFGGPAVYPDVNLLRFIQDGYSANATVYTIIAMVSRKFGSIPRYVYKIDDPKAAKQYKALLKQGHFTVNQLGELERKAYDENIIDNPLSELLNRPNPMQGQDTLYELGCTFYMLTGEAFFWLNRGDIDDLDDAAADKLPPLEMYVMPSQYIEVIPDPEDLWGVMGYYFVANGQRIFLRKNDVIHWKKPNPNFDAITRVHQRGFSPLNAGNKLVTQDNSATDAAVAMQQNDGAKGLLFNETLDKLDAVQKSQIENVINRKINNRDIKGAIATLQGKWGYLDLGQTSVDMELVKSQEAVFVRVCNLYGINPMMFLANATYENIQQARKDLVTNLILPMCCSLRDEMNRVLLPAFGLSKDFTHDVDVTQLPELQNDMGILITSLAQAWWMTPNQRLAAQNEEASNDPNMDKVWIPTGLVLMEDAAMGDVTDTLNSFSNDNGTDQGAGGSGNPDLPGAGADKGNKKGLPAATPPKGK